MKPIKDIDSVNKNNVSLPETIEDKLNEAEKDYEEGRTHTEEEIWGVFSKKYGFELRNIIFTLWKWNSAQKEAVTTR